MTTTPIRSARDIITVIRDPHHVLGKQFFISRSTGEITKMAAVSVATGIAVQHYVPDVAALEALLTQVSEDSHAAIINACFPSVPVGEEFLIVSEDRLEKHYGIRRDDSSVQWPVYVPWNGKEYPTLGRFKEHTTASTWQLLDRDVDKYWPCHYANMNYEKWLQEVEKLLPGILSCDRLRAHSSSSRVIFNGKPVGLGNGHTWFKLVNADDADLLANLVRARAVDLEMAWAKPKFSRKSGDIVGHSIASILDWTVFTRGRLVFVGKPEVHHAD